MSNPEQTDPDPLLRALVEGTSAETGVAFFRSLVSSMVGTLGIQGAWVTEFLPEIRHLRAIAFKAGDEWIEGYEYDVAGSPCERVLEVRELLVVTERVLEVFPREIDLRAYNAVGYVGAPLFDEKRERILGHIGAFSIAPLQDTALFRNVFGLFASRAGAELRRLRLERELRARTEELEALVNSAMDAILITDEERDIVRSNPAAARILGTDKLEGEFLDRFLSVDGAEKIEPLFEQLAADKDPGASLWVPGTFEARAADGSKFAAEGTLSRFELGDRRFFTLIIRNVDDRIAAERRISRLSDETEFLRQEVERHFGEIVGESPAMRKVIDAIHEVGPTDAFVLVTGETGTGKELVARAIHKASRRASMPLVNVNCAAIPANLIESEFFGHEKGAFTGATAKREGRFALADGGTLFLDEIGELPLELQSKLLRVLQEGEFEPVGSSRTRVVDVRVIAATNRDLRAEISKGRFREDLYYRISVFPMHVPALRKREGDIELLAREFASRMAARDGRSPPTISDDDMRRLRDYTWPGNVRELANVIERALITGDGSKLNLSRALPESAGPVAEPGATSRIFTAREMLEMEIENIRRALAAAGGKVSGKGGAAERLGLQPTTLSSRIKALKIV